MNRERCEKCLSSSMVFEFFPSLNYFLVEIMLQFVNTTMWPITNIAQFIYYQTQNLISSLFEGVKIENFMWTFGL